ncbi:MAG TPA: DUF3761 domain-containing protein [Rudaea sp.]
MKTWFVSVVLSAGALVSAGAFAADPPAGAIALCKDGTYFNGTSHKGACRGHQGVKDWLDKTADSSASTATKSTADSAPAATKSSKSKKSAAKTDTAAAASTTTASTAASTAPTPTSTTSPAPAATPSPTKTTTATEHKAPTPASQITAQPGGGAGKVWVNSTSKVYHCQDDQWYGKTKEGSYMTEAAAKAAGYKASHGKECQK